MTWVVEFEAGFREEFRALDIEVRKAIVAYAKALESVGPQLGRPVADSLKGSQHANMKELRPTVNKVEWRVAYAFDATRRAILLAATSKGGTSSTLAYRRMIAKADARLSAHQAAVAAVRSDEAIGAGPKRQAGKKEPKR